MLTLVDLADALARHGDRIALVDDPTGERMSYAQLDEAIQRMTRALAPTVRPGDRIGLLLYNVLEFVAAFFALQKLGAVVLPLNYRLSGEELERVVEDAGVSGIVGSVEFQPALSVVASYLTWLILLERDESPWPCDCACLADRLATEHPEPVALPKGDRDDLAVMIYTSGTTGKPKGVMLSHRNLL